MIDLQDKNICPTMEELGEYVRNPLFTQFCSEIKSVYKCGENGVQLLRLIRIRRGED